MNVNVLHITLLQLINSFYIQMLCFEESISYDGCCLYIPFCLSCHFCSVTIFLMKSFFFISNSGIVVYILYSKS